MTAAVVSIGGPSGCEEVFSRCRDVIASGGIIAYPTDTFYGLGVDPRNPAAVRRLFAVKGRSEGQPILLLIHDAGDVGRWTAQVGGPAENLMKRFWPGPLTLLFKARPDVPGEITAGMGTVGLRVPGNDQTRRLLRAVGGFLTGTSANRTGTREARTADEVQDMLGNDLDLIVDGGPAKTDKPSTIVDVSGLRPVLVRRGAVAVDWEE